jgi:hypothetical protein
MTGLLAAVVVSTDTSTVIAHWLGFLPSLVSTTDRTNNNQLCVFFGRSRESSKMKSVYHRRFVSLNIQKKR